MSMVMVMGRVDVGYGGWWMEEGEVSVVRKEAEYIYSPTNRSVWSCRFPFLVGGVWYRYCETNTVCIIGILFYDLSVRYRAGIGLSRLLVWTSVFTKFNI